MSKSMDLCAKLEKSGIKTTHVTTQGKLDIVVPATLDWETIKNTLTPFEQTQIGLVIKLPPFMDHQQIMWLS